MRTPAYWAACTCVKSRGVALNRRLKKATGGRPWRFRGFEMMVKMSALSDVRRQECPRYWTFQQAVRRWKAILRRVSAVGGCKALEGGGEAERVFPVCFLKFSR